MPPVTRSAKSPIVSPSPHLSRSRAFIMTNIVAITKYSYKFNPHPHSQTLADVLNNMYSEPFEDTTIDTFFTTAGRTTLATDIIVLLRAAIIDIIEATSQANHTVIAPIINSLILSVHVGNQRFPLRTPATFTKSLLAVTTASKSAVVMSLNTVSLQVDCSRFNVLTFDGISIHGPVAGVGTSPAAAVTTPAQIVTAAANAHAAQQTAAAAVLAATLPAVFNLLTLPTDVRTRHLHHLDPSYLLTQSDMVPFQLVTGGACPSLSHLDPPMGSGVTRQPDSNHVIARDGQFFALAD